MDRKGDIEKERATQKRQRDGKNERKKKRERNYRQNRERFIHFFFCIFNEMKERWIE